MANRRSNGEGSVHKLSNGTWQIQVMDGYKVDGTRNFKSFTAPKLEQVKKMKQEYERKRSAGMLAAADYTFSEMADIWYEHHKNLISITTQENYKYTLRHLKAQFGRKKLADIKTYDIEQFLIKLLREGSSGSAIAKCRGMLYQIFNMAVANDILIKNPVAHAEKVRRPQAKKSKDAFTVDEVKKLMQQLPDDRTGWGIRLMLATGMRAQELLGLEPRHIALDGSSVNIEQAVVMRKGSAAIGPTKTADSVRTVPVPEMVRYCAIKLRETDRKYVWEEGRLDQPCNPSYFRKQFRKAISAIADVRLLTPHCCRHTYITHMLQLGVDPKTIQALVGHSEVDMTMYYAHAQETSKQAAIDRFNEAFSNRGGGLYGNVVPFVKSS